ncbi:hypothetical protein ACMFMF_000978 [Clarireedia jacksonii]
MVLHRDDDVSAEPFLSGALTESPAAAARHDRQNHYRTSCGTTVRQRSRWLYVHFSIIFLYTLILLLSISKISRITSKSESPTTHLLSLPARPAIEWEIRKFETKTRGNPFVGEPRPELEEAWHDLLRHDNLHVDFDDFDKDMPVIKLADGSGAIAQLTVFHALHCLKKLRQWVYKDHYYASASEARLALEAGHADHCIEYIRENLMCKPDISLITYRWVNGTRGNEKIGESKAPLPSNKDLSDHECVNWERINSWAEDRAFDLFRLDLLQMPGGDE